jgi:uncharacterized protein YggU (UPF0235/DUF167 family)
MTEFYVKVKLGSDKFSIEQGTIRTVELKQKAENGRANAELVSKLEDILGERPGIVSGRKSRRKKLKIDMSEKEIDKKIDRFLKDG